MMLWLEKRKRWLAERPFFQFTLAVLTLLPACFGIWHLAAGGVALPAVSIAKPVLLAVFGDIIADVSLQGSDVLILLHYGETAGKILPAEQAGNQMGYYINTRILSYSIPFYLALYFATPGLSGWNRFIGSVSALCVLIAVGIVAMALKDIVVSMPRGVLAAAALPPTDAIALVYQFSSLMLPPLAPVLLWAYTAMDSAAFVALLPESLRPAQASAPTI